MNDETRTYIYNLNKSFEIELKNYGSSLKICKIAEGEADIYPRFGSLWNGIPVQLILSSKKLEEHSEARMVIG